MNELEKALERRAMARAMHREAKARAAMFARSGEVLRYERCKLAAALMALAEEIALHDAHAFDNLRAARDALSH